MIIRPWDSCPCMHISERQVEDIERTFICLRVELSRTNPNCNLWHYVPNASIKLKESNTIAGTHDLQIVFNVNRCISYKDPSNESLMELSSPHTCRLGAEKFDTSTGLSQHGLKGKQDFPIAGSSIKQRQRKPRNAATQSSGFAQLPIPSSRSPRGPSVEYPGTK